MSSCSICVNSYSGFFYVLTAFLLNQNRFFSCLQSSLVVSLGRVSRSNNTRSFSRAVSIVEIFNISRVLWTQLICRFRHLTLHVTASFWRSNLKIRNLVFHKGNRCRNWRLNFFVNVWFVFWNQANLWCLLDGHLARQFQVVISLFKTI